MSVSQSEITTARKAARDLVTAVELLRDHHGDSVDMRRLLADARRISEDLDLLVGPEAAANNEPLIVVPDHAYPPEFFRDADHD
ncbi:MAG: hypothetical protein WAN48_13825 [Actinomycetes bacterium]